MARSSRTVSTRPIVSERVPTRGDALTREVPTTVLPELDAAKLAHQQGHYDDARRRYQSILKRYPDLTGALHFLGVLEHMDGNSEVGLDLVQRARRQSPDDYDIRKNLGNLLNDLNHSDEAEALYRDLIAERPNDPTNHSNHCVALRKLGRLDDAVASGRRAVALAPQSPVVWLALANALVSTGELTQAVRAYERVIAVKPSFSPAHNSLCQALLQLEKTGLLSRFRMSQTRQAYRRWLAAVPGHPTASFLLEALERGDAPERMPDAAVKACFDAYADDFDKHIRTLDYRAPELVGEVLAQRLPPTDGRLDVLDGGCGTGLAASMLRPYSRRLVGVDLSSGMLDKARATRHYDSLIEAELGSFLDANTSSFDVCVFVDVLSYFGDLHAILASAAGATRPGGLLTFTVEKSTRTGSHLHPTGRYSHHPKHVQTALTAAGFEAVEQVEANIRTEGNLPVAGLIVSAKRMS